MTIHTARIIGLLSLVLRKTKLLKQELILLMFLRSSRYKRRTLFNLFPSSQNAEDDALKKENKLPFSRRVRQLHISLRESLHPSTHPKCLCKTPACPYCLFGHLSFHVCYVISANLNERGDTVWLHLLLSRACYLICLSVCLCLSLFGFVFRLL